MSQIHFWIDSFGSGWLVRGGGFSIFVVALMDGSAKGDWDCINSQRICVAYSITNYRRRVIERQSNARLVSFVLVAFLPSVRRRVVRLNANNVPP